MVARILAVEDDRVQAKILEFQLKHDYSVTMVETGEACLQAAAAGEFDIILMDVMLPGMSGYEACRVLKADPVTAEIPVIFLSANFAMDDRLQGFEAGGFDYLVKPVVKAELAKKISILLSYLEEERNLKSSAEFAANTAMTAMSSAAEQGLVLQFMKKSFACKSCQELANAVIETASQFGLNALVQIRGHYGAVCRSTDGPCTPLEASILANLSMGDRITDLKDRTAINYERASLLLKNMPTDDPERYGRYKDHLTSLLEGADARVLALDMDMYLAEEARRLVSAVKSISQTLVEVSHGNQVLHAGFAGVLNRLTVEIEHAIPLLELSAKQEAMIEEMLRQASSDYLALADQEKAADRMLLDAMEALQRVSYQVHQTPGN